MITNSEDLKGLLVLKGIKPTHQRLEILRYIRHSGKHPDADRIYHAMVKKMPTISKTTVYNTLNSFLEKGIVVPVTITGTGVCFDLAAAVPHHHLLCDNCGRIIDVNVTCPNLRRTEIDGHKIRELHGYFRGVCADCLKKKRTTD